MGLLDNAILSIGIACFAVIFVHFVGINLKVKPFTCELCMGFWFGSAVFGYGYNFDLSAVIEIFAFASLTAISAVFIYRKFLRI